MLQMIPREPGSITADTLRERLADQGYSKNLTTIQRDLNRLSVVFPIRDIKLPNSNAKHWCWSKDANLLDMPKMDTMTALTFNLVESFLIRLIPNSMLKFMHHHFKRANNILEKRGKSTWGKWSNKISIIPRGLELIPPDINQDIFESVFGSVIEERQLRLGYLKRNATKETSYLLNPLGLVFNQEVIYLVATKAGKTRIQHFALHRIKSVTTEPESAEIPKGFSLGSYVTAGAFRYLTSDDEIRLKIILRREIAGHLYESKLAPDQKLTVLKNGNVQLEAKVANSSALRWWLKAFGDGVEVLEPKELRKEFTSIARNLAKTYRNQDIEAHK